MEDEFVMWARVKRLGLRAQLQVCEADPRSGPGCAPNLQKVRPTEDVLRAGIEVRNMQIIFREARWLHAWADGEVVPKTCIRALEEDGFLQPLGKTLKLTEAGCDLLAADDVRNAILSLRRSGLI